MTNLPCRRRNLPASLVVSLLLLIQPSVRAWTPKATTCSRWRSSTSIRLIGTLIRGGDKGSSLTPHDQELDDLIENLIASVSDDDEDSLVDDNDDNDVLVGDDVVSNAARRQNVRQETQDEQTDLFQDQDEDQEEEEEEEEEEDMKKNVTDEETAEKAVADAEEPLDPSTWKAAAASTDETTTTTSSNLRPPQPPNAVYRFLLRQGPIGHVIVMILVACTEWMLIYVPLLAQLFSWLSALLLPSPPRSDLLYDDRRPSSQPFLVVGLSKRTGQSSKQRRKLMQQADQVALEQLHKVQVHTAKYRYVSDAFVQRHGLGSSSKKEMTEKVPKKEIDAVSGKKHKSNRQLVPKKAAEEVEDVEWIIQALTQEPVKSSTDLALVQPSVSLEIGPRGPSVNVGVEFTIGGKTRQSFEDVVRSSQRTQRRIRTQVRDRSGADGVLGRLRAAAGANSRMSRSLLGAYPGDAVPPSEAGSADGVIQLAERYGYGEWSDDDDDEGRDDGDAAEDIHDEELLVLPKTRKRTTKSRRTKRRSGSDSVPFPRSPTIGLNFDVSDLGSGARISSRGKTIGTVLPDTASRREPRLATLRPTGEATRSNREVPKDVKMVRPAMDRINELKKRKASNDERQY